MDMWLSQNVIQIARLFTLYVHWSLNPSWFYIIKHSPSSKAQFCAKSATKCEHKQNIKGGKVEMCI